jgi:hypothetical protein
MAKRLRILPSERIDETDLTYGTKDFTVSVYKEILRKLVIGDRPRVASGFYVDIPAQSGGTLGVIGVNGRIAIDRSGELLLSQDLPVTRKTVFLPDVSTDYFIEVEFV